MAHLTREKIEALRSEYRNRNICGKYPRQKMLPEYKKIYPWLLPDEKDAYFVFCTICECRLRAKRCDLGKHEDSIKHTENAAKKNGMKAFAVAAQNISEEKIEIFESTKTNNGPDETYIKQEPSAVGTDDYCNIQMNPNTLMYKEEEGESLVEQDDDDDEEEEDIDDDKESDYSFENLPVQVLIKEPNSTQHFSLSELARTTYNGQTNATSQFYPPQPVPPQTPCKITIKKITAPITPSITPPHITPAQRKVTLPSNALTITQQQETPTVHSSSVAVTRDPYDLFFDSICQSVKALPPKLATEGKIRVMQLIGELEMRAITEREGHPNLNCSYPNNQTGQQNATVASTTI